MSGERKIALEKFKEAVTAREAATAALEAFGEAMAALGVAVAREAWPALAENPDTDHLGTYEVPTNPVDDGADVIVTLTLRPAGLPERVLRFYFHLTSGPARLRDFVDYVSAVSSEYAQVCSILQEYGIRDAGVVGPRGLERRPSVLADRTGVVGVRRGGGAFTPISIATQGSLLKGLALVLGEA